MKNGHGGVVLGSEISGGCKNVFVENCKMDSPELERAIRIKTNSNRGGTTDGVYIKNLEIGQVREAVVKINCAYDPSEGQGDFPPLVKNVFISGVNSQSASYAIYMTGIEGKNCIENISLTNCHFNGVKNDNKISQAKNVILRDVFINNKKVELN